MCYGINRRREATGFRLDVIVEEPTGGYRLGTVVRHDVIRQIPGFELAFGLDLEILVIFLHGGLFLENGAFQEHLSPMVDLM